MSQPLLIGLTGKARSGKDTVGKLLQESLRLDTYAFAEPLKTMLKSVFGDHFHEGDRSGICPIAGVSYRALMQTLGTEWGREKVNPDLWINLVNSRWKLVKEARETYGAAVTPSGLVLTDVRFIDEAHWVRDNGGIVIEVLRPSTLRETVGVEGHASEAGIHPILVNQRIYNSGSLSDLKTTCDLLALQLKGE